MTRRRRQPAIVNLVVPGGIGALMHELPEPGAYLSREQRAKWLTAMSSMLNLYYPAEVDRAASLALDAERAAE